MTPFQVYAFCEGVWRTPAWCLAVDLNAHGVNQVTLTENTNRAVKAFLKAPWKANASNVVLEPAPTPKPALSPVSGVVEVPRKYRQTRRQISGPSHNDVGTFPGDFITEWVPEDDPT